VKFITTFQSPPADNLYRLVEVHCVHNFEQPLLLWAIVAGLQAGPKLAAGRAGPQNGLEIADRVGPKIFGPCTSLPRSHLIEIICTNPELRLILWDCVNNLNDFLIRTATFKIFVFYASFVIFILLMNATAILHASTLLVCQELRKSIHSVAN